MVDITNITWKLRAFTTVAGSERPIPATAEVTLLLHMPSMTETSDSRAMGKAGCNSYSGSYSIHDSSLTVTGPIVSTKMYCNEMATETEYLDALSRAVRYRSDGTTLMIYYGDGDHILLFSKS